MASVEQITFRATTPNERLDKLIVDQLGDRLSRAQIQTLIKNGLVRVDGRAFKAGQRLKGGETIAIDLPEPPAPRQMMAEAIPLHVIYEDDDLAVIDKPAGLVVHPGAGASSGTLVNALLDRYPEIAAMRHAEKRRGIVHRLDKDTSGLIVVARREAALRHLMTQFQRRTVDKVYLALTERPPRTPSGLIKLPLARDPADRTRIAVQRGGRTAITEYHTEMRFRNGMTLLRVRLYTGRTHQIRVHLAYVGAPIVGDTLYGYKRRRLVGRQFLHAVSLCFDHPTTRERRCFEAPLPADLQEALDALRGAQETD
jgi:23S rRNA pseudouridine1911/1915/1917 synthase